MKKIEAIIRTTKFDSVRDALAQIGVKFFTLKEVKGYGLQKGKVLKYRGSSYGRDFIARLQLDIVTTEDKVTEIVDTIIASGKTGEVGDGKIFVMDIDSIVRIRNGEIDASAI
ncbi:MAG: P-II family nitrogen regulator [Bacteroidota bacterium]